MALRYLDRFENSAGTTVVTFGLNNYEWQSQQGLRVASTPSIGADFAYDPLRSAVAPMDVASEHVRFLQLSASAAAADTAIDLLRSQLLTIGRGKLWTIDGSAVRRWAWARLVAMPDITISVPSIRWAPVALEFRRYSSWYKATPESVVQAISATPTNFNVTNPGNLPAKFMVIRLRATGAAGLTHPKLLNNTNLYEFSSVRDGSSANSVLKVDTELQSVQYANNDNATSPADDSGVTYADDFANFTIGPAGATQVGFFRLEPGVNALTYSQASGTPALSLEMAFFAPYA